MMAHTLDWRNAMHEVSEVQRIQSMNEGRRGDEDGEKQERGNG